MCPYAYYEKKEGIAYEVIMCKKTKSNCPYSKFCAKENRVTPNNTEGYTMSDCNLNREKNIPKGSVEVIHPISDLNFLYFNIETDEGIFTQKIKNTLGEVPDYIYVRLVNNEYQIVKRKRK